MKFQTQADYDRFGVAEANSGKSQTVPDQVMSIKELLKRHQSGLIVHQYQPIYDEDGYMPDPRSMDLTDVDDLKRKNNEIIRETKEKARTNSGKSSKRSGSTQSNPEDGKEQPEKGASLPTGSSDDPRPTTASSNQIPDA